VHTVQLQLCKVPIYNIQGSETSEINGIVKLSLRNIVHKSLSTFVNGSSRRCKRSLALLNRWRGYLLEFVALNIPHYINGSRLFGHRVVSGAVSSCSVVVVPNSELELEFNWPGALKEQKN
jgi:hypothetical protein